MAGNNSDPCEIGALLPDGTVAIGEIEYGGDGLDATRRAIAGVAIARSRHKVPDETSRAVVIILRLPNARTDVYRLIDDLGQVLSLDVVLVPMASLVSAAISGRQDALVALLTPDSAITPMDQPAEAFRAAFGSAGKAALASAGIVPQK